MAYRIKWEGAGEERRNNCGGVCELTYTVGMFYIFLICLGLLFVTLKQRESLDAQVRPAESALFQALLPYDSGR